MQNGENIQALHKNLELIRFVSVALLLVHFYAACFPAFTSWGLTNTFATKVLFRLSNALFLLRGITAPKLTVLVLLAISQFGEHGKKDTDLTIRPILTWIAVGLLLYLSSTILLDTALSETTIAVLYITCTATGYLFVLFGGARLSRLIHVKLGKDPFNLLEETFPQEERLLENEFSINLPAQYNLKGKIRKSWINIVNPFRALLVLGTPGSGKSFFCIRHVITQHIAKGFTCYIYDFKFPDLTLIAYNTALKHLDKYPVPPQALPNQLRRPVPVPSVQSALPGHDA